MRLTVIVVWPAQLLNLSQRLEFLSFTHIMTTTLYEWLTPSGCAKSTRSLNLTSVCFCRAHEQQQQPRQRQERETWISIDWIELQPAGRLGQTRLSFLRVYFRVWFTCDCRLFKWRPIFSSMAFKLFKLLVDLPQSNTMHSNDNNNNNHSRYALFGPTKSINFCSRRKWRLGSCATNWQVSFVALSWATVDGAPQVDYLCWSAGKVKRSACVGQHKDNN